jgi:hypothetical protein
MTVEAYQAALKKHGIGCELSSPAHMAALCNAVASGEVEADDVARCVIAYGRFEAPLKLSGGGALARTLLVVPPEPEVIRSVVRALMPLPQRCDQAGYGALDVLRALRPSGGEPRIKVAASRLVNDAKKGVKGDIAAAYSVHELSKCRANGHGEAEPGRVAFFEHDGKFWTTVAGSQLGGKKPSKYYAWDACEIVPEDKFEANPDEWHLYYGRRVIYGKNQKGILGRRVKFVPK